MFSNMCMYVYICTSTRLQKRIYSHSYTIPCTYHYQLKLSTHLSRSTLSWPLALFPMLFALHPLDVPAIFTLLYHPQSTYHHTGGNQIYLTTQPHLTRINELNQQHTHKHTHYYCYNWLVIKYVIFIVFCISAKNILFVAIEHLILYNKVVIARKILYICICKPIPEAAMMECLKMIECYENQNKMSHCYFQNSQMCQSKTRYKRISHLSVRGHYKPNSIWADLIYCNGSTVLNVSIGTS